MAPHTPPTLGSAPAKDEEERQALKLVSKTGASKERKLVRWVLSGSGDLDKILVRFLAPRDVENTGLLKKNRFMGTDFSYGDDCFVVDATPATERQAADSGYSRRRIWVRKDTHLTVKREAELTR